MAQLPQMFDARTVAPHIPGAGSLPVGDYVARITGSEMKLVKNNANAGYVEFTYTVIEGEFAGRTMPYRLNLMNANPQTVEIAQRQLSAICHATGQVELYDTTQVHDIAHIIVVGEQKEQEKGKPIRTEIKGVKPLSAGVQNVPNPANSGAVYQGDAAPAQAPQQPAQAAPAPHGVVPLPRPRKRRQRPRNGPLRPPLVVGVRPPPQVLLPLRGASQQANLPRPRNLPLHSLPKPRHNRHNLLPRPRPRQAGSKPPQQASPHHGASPRSNPAVV